MLITSLYYIPISAQGISTSAPSSVGRRTWLPHHHRISFNCDFSTNPDRFNFLVFRWKSRSNRTLYHIRRTLRDVISIGKLLRKNDVPEEVDSEDNYNLLFTGPPASARPFLYHNNLIITLLYYKRWGVYMRVRRLGYCKGHEEQYEGRPWLWTSATRAWALCRHNDKRQWNQHKSSGLYRETNVI